ncbi:MAG TPA: NADP oxidoreductase [Armatimonadota bacterium]|jgi:NAD-reducing hydrogenase small subunit|nr:NADP oxidoreductase [Armatimonadota bacterium]
MEKPKLATDWLADCAGCHMSLLDIDERIVALLEKATLTSSPITDLKHPPETGVELGVLSGACGNTSNVAVARMMRKRCGKLLALGDCAVFGGILSLRNGFDMKEALSRAYIESESTVDGFIPDSEELAKPIRNRPLDQVVEVDAYLPGCPPSADAIFETLVALVEGREPPVEGELLKYD